MQHRLILALLLAAGLTATWAADGPSATLAEKATPEPAALQAFLKLNCLACHDHATKTGGLALDDLSAAGIDRNTEAWEKVVRKLASREMPPAKETPRPTERDYDQVIASLAGALDAAAAKAPNPGRTETFRRLNRTEYHNTIRDLLDLDVDVAALLPQDESSHGFDNITVADLSPSLLNRYVSAAQKISRIAVGVAPRSPDGYTVRIRPDVTQDTHIDGLPIGTRGGTLVSHNFPQDGEYEIQIHLMRDRDEGVEGLREPDELEVMLDRERVDLIAVKPPPKGTDASAAANLKSRMKVKAGPHQVGVAFIKHSSSLLETTRQPLNVHYNFYRHPRLGPAVYEVSIVGPFEASGPGDTPSRRRIFTCRPKSEDDEESRAQQILTTLARRAYRRPVDGENLKPLLKFYRLGRADADFDAGIETALSSLLVNPQFLFRIERDPADTPTGTAYRVSDVELATRLSYFLWSSMPDDELLDLAAEGKLHRPEVLERQVRRMLADKRSRSLVENFAGQWLYLRNLDSVIPDMRLYPDFDDNLRQAMRQETELFLGSILREDRSVLELLKSDATYLNERLAKHYEIPNVYGSHFRRVKLDDDSHRGGLLRQGSILSVTSYATRTSPVLRGHWVLQNLVGTPPPPPPPNVPVLTDNTVSNRLPMRERLTQHRANTACASCHDRMDPVGFSLENFDAVGHWHGTNAGQPIDASGGFQDGSEFTGVSGLEQALLKRPELFVRTLTEKLLTFGLGRGVETFDGPAVRQIVRETKDDNYRFSRLIVSIVQSTPFQMRKTP